MPAHETSYSQFVQATFVGSAAVINILIGLAIGGVLGHWLPAAFILVAAVVPADQRVDRSRVVSLAWGDLRPHLAAQRLS